MELNNRQIARYHHKEHYCRISTVSGSKLHRESKGSSESHKTRFMHNSGAYCVQESLDRISTRHNIMEGGMSFGTR
jgi:hypothetical protein